MNTTEDFGIFSIATNYHSSIINHLCEGMWGRGFASFSSQGRHPAYCVAASMHRIVNGGEGD